MTVFKGRGWLKAVPGKWKPWITQRLDSLTGKSENKPDTAEQLEHTDPAALHTEALAEQANQSAVEALAAHEPAAALAVTAVTETPDVQQLDAAAELSADEPSETELTTIQQASADVSDEETVQAVQAEVQEAADQAAAATALGVGQQPGIHISGFVKKHKWQFVQACAVIGLLTGATLWGHQYVDAHMDHVYHVQVNGVELGTVKDVKPIEQIKIDKKKEIEENSGKVELELDEPEIKYSSERIFMAKTNDAEVLQKVPQFFEAHPVGMQMKVDGKVIGVLKDQATANNVLQAIKDKTQKKEPGKVGILSASSGSTPPDEVELQSIEFVQKVELNKIELQSQDVADPQEIIKKLETGDIQPTKYTVEKGDCVSCIAKKFNISKQIIYQNNPWIVDDKIKVGQQLDLTVLEPTLAVKTVEKITESQEIQYETEYKTDDTLRAGTVQAVSPGKNGLKKVTIIVTKVNGITIEEKVDNEQVIQQPVKAVAKKGTKVIKGEGTGKFAWPVLGASISSTFGTRWGVLHKGIDLTSSNKTIMAADNGKVVYAGFKSDYGNHVIIDHMNGYQTLYAHMSQLNTSVGKIVEKGEKIGVMGSTGDATGVHLHFEVHKGGGLENPLKYLNR
ncbi:peptidoglycan DD-metalloendopeptidase family protein [Paenibacillus thalictri]|uniref:LysM peptidoglycan-binding domain-containing protein n=1 Tax=Paenibacillus thalictri TaxID=2527873 RepID=A0A4V2J438_9BACL|nr:peptidoglycan DD-metalloendopeptidase family protein [Paenibacillus thalictri]TBL77443.1 LysM peptidoglycan-binding domain-containing protein [Paenibacillus thalictri]